LTNAGPKSSSPGSPAHCCAGAPSEPCVQLVAAHGSSKPRGRRGVQCGRSAYAGNVRPVADGVYEAVVDIAGWAGSPASDGMVGDHRRAGDGAPPPFPVGRGLGRPVGGQQVIPAQRAARALLGEQAQSILTERGFDLASPFSPVLGQVGVIRGCPTRDRDVPDDAGPGEFRPARLAGPDQRPASRRRRDRRRAGSDRSPTSSQPQRSRPTRPPTSAVRGWPHWETRS
jgi:hypothetical protein